MSIGREVPKPFGMGKIAHICGGLVMSTLFLLYSQARKWIPASAHLIAVGMIFAEAAGKTNSVWHGVICGLIALPIPVMPEAYVFFRFWQEVGFLNWYTLLFAVECVTYALPFLIVWIVPLLFGGRRD